MNLKIRHLTVFRYAHPIAGGKMKIRMMPWNEPGQQVIGRELDLCGSELVASFRDHFGNSVELAEVAGGRTELRIEIRTEVETAGRAGMARPCIQDAPQPIFREATPNTAPGEAISRISRQFAGDDLTDPATMHRLSDNIRSVVDYRVGSTGTVTTAEEAAQRQQGVCQDHAHIFIAAARQLGLPARYVSGYLRMHGRVEQEAMHAWAEVYIKDLGWAGFDVSNGISPDENYVKIAVGRDYFDAAPMTGIVRGGGEEQMTVTIEAR